MPFEKEEELRDYKINSEMLKHLHDKSVIDEDVNPIK